MNAGKQRTKVKDFGRLINGKSIKTIPLNLDKNWRSPPRDVTNQQTSVVYDNLVSQSLKKHYKNRGVGYEQSSKIHLRTLLSDIESVFGFPITPDALRHDIGFAFPNTITTDDSYSSISDRTECEEFFEKILDFPKGDQTVANKVSTFYLLGYTGSGKSCLNRYFQEKNAEKLSAITHIDIPYEDLEYKLDELIGEEQDVWDKKIEEVINTYLIDDYLRKIETDDARLKFFELPVDIKIQRILPCRNILITIDGFDELSVRQINERSISMFFTSVKVYLRNLTARYNRLKIRNKKCHFFITLRKCTYELLSFTQIIDKRKDHKTYWLESASFKDVLKESFQLVKFGKTGSVLEFYENYTSDILDILEAASNKADEVLNFDNSQSTEAGRRECSFDRNYRRRLRFIACLIYRASAKVTYIICKGGNVEIDRLHSCFFEMLLKEINKLGENQVIDIFVYGVNSGFNNHFSSVAAQEAGKRPEDYHDPSSYCGFVDNVFWYLNQDFSGKVNPLRFLIMVRILQVLEGADNQYLSVADINDELKKMGYSTDDDEILCFLKYLELDLLARSRRILDSEAEKDSLETDTIQFKCSNFGKLFIRKVLLSYSYISGVSKTSMYPQNLWGKVNYLKRQYQSQNYVLTEHWKKESSINVIYFLRLLKTIEEKYENKDATVKFQLANKMIRACSSSIDAIMNSDHSGLNPNEIEQVYNKCESAINQFSTI